MKKQGVSIRDLMMGELIGKDVTVLDHTLKGVRGLKGKVLDETRNMLVVGTEAGRVSVPKKGCGLGVLAEDGRTLVIDGDRLTYRPEDRTKRCDRTQEGVADRGNAISHDDQGKR